MSVEQSLPVGGKNLIRAVRGTGRRTMGHDEEHLEDEVPVRLVEPQPPGLPLVNRPGTYGKDTAQRNPPVPVADPQPLEQTKGSEQDNRCRFHPLGIRVFRRLLAHAGLRDQLSESL